MYELFMHVLPGAAIVLGSAVLMALIARKTPAAAGEESYLFASMSCLAVVVLLVVGFTLMAETTIVLSGLLAWGWVALIIGYTVAALSVTWRMLGPKPAA